MKLTCQTIISMILENEFDKTLGDKFKLKCEFYLKEEKPKMAVFVSKYDHCLYDILSQHINPII